MPIPTPAMKVVVDSMGNKMMLPDVELTKLADLIKPLESRVQIIVKIPKKLFKIAAQKYHEIGNYPSQIMARVAGTFR